MDSAHGIHYFQIISEELKRKQNCGASIKTSSGQNCFSFPSLPFFYPVLDDQTISKCIRSKLDTPQEWKLKNEQETRQKLQF